MRFKKKGDYVQALEVCDPQARLLVAREDFIRPGFIRVMLISVVEKLCVLYVVCSYSRFWL